MAIFGAIALVGLLGASIMTFMKGPLSTSVRLTKMNTAENQMALGAQVAVMATAGQANNGDCETTPDGFVEPIGWRVATTEPHPIGGGLVPLTLGISKKDPWGTEYGYCVWNHGPVTSGAGCSANMRIGENSRAYPVVAVISAGPDKAFTTTCRDFTVADVNGNHNLLDATDLPLVSKAAETDDDIITSYTYEEATGASGGLWSLKSTDAGTAVINKKIEASGVADLKGGVLLPDKALLNCSDIKNAGVMAKSALGIEICDGAGTWTSIGGASGALGTTATCAAPADAGHVRYNSTSGQPEFCNGTTWLPFSINTPGVNLVISPNNSSTINVNGAVNADTVRCTVGNGLTCGSPVTFTVTNQGTLTSATTVIQLIQTINGTPTTFSAAALSIATNTSNFVITANTCTTTLAVNATCTVTLEPKASGNTSYTATLKVNTNNAPIAIISGSSTNFGCTPGRVAGGGIYAYCGLTDIQTGSNYDLIVQPGGCTGTTTNPACAGGTDTVTKVAAIGCCTSAQVSTFYNYVGHETYGARNSMTILKMVSLGMGTFPATQYCRQMNYNGYTDWYLPSRQEMVSFIYPNKTLIGGFQNNIYSTSLLGTNSDYGYVDMSSGGNGGEGVGYSRYVRCARRENIALPVLPALNTPVNISLTPGISFTPSARMSATATVSGILDPMTVTIAGSTGNPTFKVNGGAEVTTATVTNGQTVQFLMDAPSVLGTQYSATINWGPTQVLTWKTGYADITKTARIFVTSGTFGGGQVNGLSGGDALCNAAAASSPLGLPSGWKAVMSDDSVAAADRIPWSWGTLKNMNGQTVVDGGFSDLFDGTLDNPVGYTQANVPSSGAVWTASTSAGGIDPGSFNAAMGYANHGCSNWTGYYTYNGNNMYATIGYANQSSASWISATGVNCAENTHPLYCFEDITSASDVIPTALNIPYNIQAAASSRETTVTTSIVIGGMSSGATTTMSVTATGGNPTFTINGGAEVTSGTIQNGDSIMFLMDAPATASTSYKMTIKSGSSNIMGYWRVWTGWDGIGTGIKRVFVTSTDPNGAAFGGVAGADPYCQARATAQGLGGTWKAILSGIAESEWAVNRVGYNWNELRLMDGTTRVAYAPNLWGTLQNSISLTEAGVPRNGVRVLSGTAANGNAYSTVSDLSNLYNWTGASCSATYMQGNSAALTAGISQGYWLCQSDGALYCIEQ